MKKSDLNFSEIYKFHSKLVIFKRTISGLNPFNQTQNSDSRQTQDSFVSEDSGVKVTDGTSYHSSRSPLAREDGHAGNRNAREVVSSLTNAMGEMNLRPELPSKQVSRQFIIKSYSFEATCLIKRFFTAWFVSGVMPEMKDD